MGVTSPPSSAYLAATTAAECREVVAENWGLSELVEAATRCGRTDIGTDALNRLAAKADATGTDWARGIEARARALVADDADAERWYRASVAHLSRTQVRAELARTHLLYGEWLRRQGRRRDARGELNVAHEQFETMGMEAFTQRASNELVGTGEKRRTRITEQPDALTGQERHVAELARDGLSNPQIGARLFLSSRTVEWHLRHVYAKLEIRSRRALRGAL